jgi:hypothetical protein
VPNELTHSLLPLLSLFLPAKRSPPRCQGGSRIPQQPAVAPGVNLCTLSYALNKFSQAGGLPEAVRLPKCRSTCQVMQPQLWSHQPGTGLPLAAALCVLHCTAPPPLRFGCCSAQAQNHKTTNTFSLRSPAPALLTTSPALLYVCSLQHLYLATPPPLIPHWHALPLNPFSCPPVLLMSFRFCTADAQARAGPPSQHLMCPL